MPKKLGKQLSFDRVSGWGGRRRGAGRINRSGRASHMCREKIDSRKPVHITLRLRQGMPNLRRSEFLEIFAAAVRLSQRFGITVNHFTILGNHIHLIVEATDNKSLSRGLQSLKISLAKGIKRFARLQLKQSIKGSIFDGRYHMHVLSAPTEYKNALEYVLKNESRHGGRHGVSIYSSSFQFSHAKKLGIDLKNARKVTEFWRALTPMDQVVGPPKSWLGSQGWLRTVGAT